MEINSIVKNFGNSLGFSIPKILANELTLNVGDELVGIPVAKSGLILLKKEDVPLNSGSMRFFADGDYQNVNVDIKNTIPLKVSLVGDVSLFVIMSKAKLNIIGWLPNTELSLNVSDNAISIDTCCGYNNYTSPKIQKMKLAHLKLSYELLQTRIEMLINNKSAYDDILTNMSILDNIHKSYCSYLDF